MGIWFKVDFFAVMPVMNKLTCDYRNVFLKKLIWFFIPLPVSINFFA